MVNLYDPAYYETPEWKAHSKLLKQLGGNCCILCDNPLHLESDHKNYVRFGGDELFIRDTIPLCDRCHRHKKLFKGEFGDRMLTFLYDRHERLKTLHVKIEELAEFYANEQLQINQLLDEASEKIETLIESVSYYRDYSAYERKAA